MALWNVWVGEPSILRDEDVGKRWVGHPPPMASLGHGAGSGFNPQDRQGINSGHQGLSASRDLLSQWLQEDFGSCVCCSCPCTRASAGSLIFKRLLWQISSHLGRWQRLEGPGSPIRVRIPGGLSTPSLKALTLPYNPILPCTR